jgi:hypothetical protein
VNGPTHDRAGDTPLDRAARSLREQTARENDLAGGEETLASVVSQVRGRARRRRALMVMGVQALLATMAVGAWAAASGRLDAWLERMRPAARAPAPAAARATRPPRPARVAIVAPAAAPPPAPAPAAARAPARLAVRTPVPPPGDEDSLYRTAHEAHFQRRDFAAALAAWDRYLALPGPVRFALEARYNRAIALYRLGQHDQAAQALSPFATGEYGPYRKHEARALLERLGSPIR